MFNLDVLGEQARSWWDRQRWVRPLKFRVELTSRETGEIAQQLGAVTVLPEVLSSIPNNHMVAHNHL